MKPIAVILLSGCTLELSPLDFACALDVDCGDGTFCVDGRCGPPARCGDGVVHRGEGCDDGAPSDGCVDCEVMFGFSCTGTVGEPSSCERTRYMELSAGGFHVCALTMDGLVECDGSNTLEGESTGQAAPPNELGPFHGLALGAHHSCAIRDEDDRAVCWGSNIGRASTAANQSIVPLDLGPVAAVSPGGTHTCALTVESRVRCWGEINGQTLETPSPIPPDLEVAGLASASFHTCVRDTNREIRCWGARDRIVAPSGPFASFEAGFFHTCAIDDGGLIACWGKDDNTVRRTIPPEEPDFVSVSSGHYHNCAVRRDGRVRCWGTPPLDAELAQGDPPPGTFRQVAAGALFTCGLREGGELDCWGRILPLDQ